MYCKTQCFKMGRIGLFHRPNDEEDGSCDPFLLAEAIRLLGHNEERDVAQFVLVHSVQSEFPRFIFLFVFYLICPFFCESMFMRVDNVY